MNMTEIAQQLGVSQATVSRVLNHQDKGHVGAATAEKIRQFIRQSNFVRNSQASTLRTGKSNVVGLILPWNTPELMDTIERACAEKDMNLLVQFTPLPDEAVQRKALEVMLEQQVSSLIWEPCISCDDSLIQRAKTIANVAFLGDNSHVPHAIRFDYEQGLQQLYTHAEQQGYKRIALIGIPRDFPLLQVKHSTCSHTCTIIHDECTKTWEKEIRPGTLVVAWNDWIGIRVFNFLMQKNMNIPQDIGIVVIGNLLLGNSFRISDIFKYPFSCLTRDFSAMGKAVTERIFAKRPTSCTLLIPLNLSVRKSSQRLP